MNIFFNTKDFVERSRDLGRTNLLFIFGIIKAASIGIAVTVFLQIFIDLGPVWSWQSIFQHFPLFLLWGVSYFCLLVTYDSAVFATIFFIHIPKKSETFFTFLLVGTEALQFAILSPSLLNETKNKFIMSVEIHDWWYIIFGFYCLFMYFLVHFAKIELNESKKDFSLELKIIFNAYLSSFIKAKIFISIALFLTLGIFITLLLSTNDNFTFIIRIISALLFLSINSSAFFVQQKQRLIIENLFKANKAKI
jgi:hypothetical protein